MAYRVNRRNVSARGRRTRRGRSPIRTTHWYRQPLVPMVGLTTGPVAIDLLPDTVLDPGARLGATIIRIHMVLRAHFVVSQIETPAWMFWVGIYVGPALAPAPPPGPGAHANDVDWMFWKPVTPGSPGNLVFGTAPDQHVSAALEFDIKSQRRFYEPTDKAWLVGQLENNSGITTGLEPTFTSSVLIKR